MPRAEVILGEMTQPQVGAIRGSAGSIGAGWVSQGATPRQVGFAPPNPPRKRPCCKTCDNRGCVGHCKF
jgi:hypothetical protein